ncbi:MAG: hypothetical protein ACJAYB_000217 [Psychromonas sp.]|jgi:hypothetical protein
MMSAPILIDKLMNDGAFYQHRESLLLLLAGVLISNNSANNYKKDNYPAKEKMILRLAIKAQVAKKSLLR